MARKKDSTTVAGKTFRTNEARPLGTKKPKAVRPNRTTTERAKDHKVIAGKPVIGRFTSLGAPNIPEESASLPSANVVDSLSESGVAIPAIASGHDKTKEIPVLTFTHSKTAKSGNHATYKNESLRYGILVPKTLFAGGSFPASIDLGVPEGVALNLRSAGEMERLTKLNEKRVAEGKKPLPTPAERAVKVAARQARLAKQVERAAKEAAKLAAKLGTAVPAAPEAPAVAEPVVEQPAQ